MHDGYRAVARSVKEHNVDALIIVALDHLHNHFLNLVPQFTIFTGNPVVAQFNRRRIELNGSPELANSLMDGLLDRGFDPAFSQNEVLDHSFLVPLNLHGGRGPGSAGDPAHHQRVRAAAALHPSLQ